MHYRLQNGREWRDADSGADEHRVLRPEDLRRRRSERTVNVNLKRPRVKICQNHVFNT